MKKCFLVLCLSVLYLAGKSQQFNTDSLLNIKETSKNDTVRNYAMEALIYKYQIGNLDTLVLYAKKIIIYGHSHNIPYLEALGDDALGYAFYRMGNLAQLQAYVLKAAVILNKYPDNLSQCRNANLYAFFQPTDSLKIFYEKKAIAYALQAYKNEYQRRYLSVIYMNLSSCFNQENKLDSALAYAQRAYDIAIFDSNTYAHNGSFIIGKLSGIYSQLHQYDLALTYAKMSLAAAQKNHGEEGLDFAYHAMAEYFDSARLYDAAFYYYSKIYTQPSTGFYRDKVEAAKWLYKFYDNKGNKDSALSYLKFYVIANDSLNSDKETSQIEKINLQENLRRQQLEEQQAKEKESEKHNIQFVIIAIAILSCALLFLLISRSFIVSHKTIEILSAIILLIFFEFINLLLHDYLSGITNDSPLLMLLALVLVASLIVPLHHRLEQWATKKLVKKNKEIRLAKARKIVEQLESKIN